MAIPVIKPTQSILGYLQWEEFEFQLFAANTPTSWTATGLPAGLSIDAGGLISGAAEKPGVYVFSVTATNASGTSPAVQFTMGIEASVADPTANVVDLAVDLGTRLVSAIDGTDGAALFTGKFRDDLILRVHFQRKGIPVDITMTELNLVLKEFEPEAVLAQSSAFSDAGDGVHLVYIQLSGDALQSALSNYEDDKATMFPAACEFEWLAPNALGVGPDPARGSSRTFQADIVRDLNELTP